MRNRGLKIKSRCSRKPNEIDTPSMQLSSSSLSSSSSSPAPLELIERWPRRYSIVALCFASFLLCNLDRVNMSIAILPMAAEFQWSSLQMGIVHSSFFIGYLSTQILGGVLATKFGGKQVLGTAVLLWSMATCLTPYAASLGLTPLLVTRMLMGVGEGSAMPAMNQILSKWVGPDERSRSLSLVYSGMFLGSVLGLSLSPIMIEKLGWPSVFVAFGSIGPLWWLAWQKWAKSEPDASISSISGLEETSSSVEIPWGALLSRPEVWTVIFCHFCHNYATFLLLSFMPTFFHGFQGLDLTLSGLFSVLPWISMAVGSNVGGWMADGLISNKFMSITGTRKVMQSIGFLAPAFFLFQLRGVTSPYIAVTFFILAQGLDAFGSQPGLYSNHQDLSTKYSGILLGLSNTAGVMAGVLSSIVTGRILNEAGANAAAWDDVFLIAIVFQLAGALVWNLFATGERIFD